MRTVNIKSGDSGFNSMDKTAIIEKMLVDMPYSRGYTLRQFTVRVLEFYARSWGSHSAVAAEDSSRLGRYAAATAAILRNVCNYEPVDKP